MEYSRDFYRVFENGSMDWADSVYGGSCRLDLSPYFKKRGWCYERETRLVVTLREGVDVPTRPAVRFCGPFDELERQMKGSGRERNLPVRMVGPARRAGRMVGRGVPPSRRKSRFPV